MKRLSKRRKTRKRFRAVFFDIGNVLLRFEPGCILRTFVRVLGKNPAKVLAFLKARDLIDPIERGLLPPQELYRRFCETFGFTGSFKAFKLLWSDHFTLERATAAMLKSAAKTHKVYLLSNTNAIHYEFIEKNYAFPRHIHGAFLSHELGLRKPEPAIYKEALKRARVSPGESIFIDDLAENVEGARKAGIHAILYPGPKELRRLLTELGVL
ncbi:MAG: HAD family phosphatase [Elusimicrobia bacterium]|nr:HAD family phosphatase [Elusimicrobiota bacterium]